MSMIDVHTAIETRLKAVVPGIKTVERYYGQLEMMAQGTGYTIQFLACFYELSGMRCTTQTRGIQQCEGILRLRHCDQALVASQLRTPQLEQASYWGLSGFRGGPLLTGLERTALYPDTKYRGVEVIISEYTIKYTDVSLLNKTTALVAGSELEGEVAIQ